MNNCPNSCRDAAAVPALSGFTPNVRLLLMLWVLLASTVGWAQSADTVTQPPTLAAPISGTLAGSKLSVAFTLPETAASGSVKLIFSGAATTTLTLAATNESAGPHSFNFNPGNPTASAAVASGTAIASGIYTVTLSYQDLAGNAAATSSVGSVTIDATGPAGGTFTVTGKAPVVAGRLLTAAFRNWTDAHKPLTYGVYADDGSGEITVVAPGKNALPTFRLPAGTFTVRGRVFDSLGNVTVTSPVTLTVQPLTTDLVAPVVKILKPAANTILGTFTLSGTVQENFAIQSFVVRVNGIERKLDAPLVFRANTALRWSVSGIPPILGVNNVEVQATDYAGRTTTVTRALTFLTRTDLATSYYALLRPVGAQTLGTVGMVLVSVTRTGAFTARALVGGVTVPFVGSLDVAGVAKFRTPSKTSIDLIGRTGYDTYFGALAFQVSNVTGMTGTLSTQVAGGTVLANFSAQSSPYTSLNRVPTSFLNVPTVGTPTSGYYTIALKPKEQTPVVDHALYPQAFGFARLSLGGTGGVTMSGRLADGTVFSTTSRLRADGTIPLFLQTYNQAGAFGGELTLADLADSDVSGTDLLWMRPAIPQARYYPAGWANGIRVDAVGAKYNRPASLDLGQGRANLISGNVLLNFSEGLLSAATTRPASIDSLTGSLRQVASPGKPYRLFLVPTTGALTGTFTHDGVTDSFYGVVVSKGLNRGGFGYFLSTPALVYGESGQAGAMTLQSRAN